MRIKFWQSTKTRAIPFPRKEKLMPLIVNYTQHKSWDASTEKFADPQIRTEADQLGHLLMIIGISEISDKTINEIIIRKMILDRLYGDATYTLEHYREKFEKHLGLFIGGRWASNETRWKFVARHAKGMVRDIANQVTKD